MRPHRALCSLLLAALVAGALISAQPAPARLDRALAAQRLLVESNPGDAGALNDLGNLLELAGDRRGAEEAYLRAIELDPRDPSPRFNRGLLLASTGRRRAALSELREVVDLDPGHAWAHYQIGAIWDHWGFDRWARRSYARAFELDPQLADPRVNPDVLDNREATAAMLLAWKRGTPAAAAPRAYSDAGRIASLLIEVPAGAGEPGPEDELTAEEEEGAGGGFARLTRPPQTAPGGSAGAEWRDTPAEELAEGGSGDSDSGGRVLDASDLSGGRTLNQVVAPGAGARSPAAPSARSGRGTILRRVPTTRTVGSTGRLEPVLRPVDPQAAAIAG